MNDSEAKKRQRHFDRVTLSAGALAKLDRWIEQVESAKPGVLVTRKDILNWLVQNMADDLSASQEKSLADTFYSELRYLQFAEKAIRAAAVKGERLTLKDLAERSSPVRELTKKRPRSRSDDARPLSAAEESVATHAISEAAAVVKS